MVASDNVHLHLKTGIPLIAEIVFHLVVTADIPAAHRVLKLPFTSDCSPTGGECHMEDGSFDIYLIIEQGSLTHDWLGHELFHSVNNICDRIGYKVKRKNDEMGARIAGFLHGWVYKNLEKNLQKITH